MKRRFFSYLRRRFSFFRYTIAILNLTTFFSALSIILVLVYALTDVIPYIKLSKGGKLGLTDFEHGIPVPVRFTSGYIPDSSFYGQSSQGSWSFTSSASRQFSQGPHWDSLRSDKDAHVDTVSTEFEISYGYPITENKGVRPAYISDGQVLSGVLHVQTQRKGWRLLLLLPTILYLSLLAFGAWQIGSLLNDILNGAAFTVNNYRRIRNIGWGVIAWQLILFTLQLTCGYWSVFVIFNSTIPDYHSPLQLSAAYNYDLSLSWLTGGSILLIVAYAFRKGNQLQNEQDLTV